MIWAVLLITGGVLRCIGEAIQILSIMRTPLGSALSILSLLMIGVGFIGLWPDTRQSRMGWTGRAGIVLIGTGALGFSAIGLWSLTQGLVPLETVARSLPFIAVALVTLGGALLLVLWLVINPFYPRWIGLVMCGAITLSLFVSFWPFSSVAQPLIDVVMALAFIQLGLSMAARRKRSRKTK